MIVPKVIFSGENLAEMVHNLSAENSLVGQYVAELRDVEVQHDRMRFRRNLERIAEIASYELSKTLAWQSKSVDTPLGKATVIELQQQPVIATILRAGLVTHQGVLNYFDKGDNAYITAYRKHDESGNFTIELGYVACPTLEGRDLIVSDPMLATGASMVSTLENLFAFGEPRHTHIICAIASQPGIDHVLRYLPNASIWAGDIDKDLNDKAYIVPGLGDAGDLAYGEKLQN